MKKRRKAIARQANAGSMAKNARERSGGGGGSEKQNSLSMGYYKDKAAKQSYRQLAKEMA